MTSKLRRLTLSAIAAAALATPFAAQFSAHADTPLKVGFLAKMPEQARFISEQKAAAPGQKDGFPVINIGTPDGEKVLAAIDNLSADRLPISDSWRDSAARGAVRSVPPQQARALTLMHTLPYMLANRRFHG